MVRGDNMAEAICLLTLTLFAVLYIFGYIHDFIFWVCRKIDMQKNTADTNK